MTLPRLTPNQIEQIARVIGDTGNGFNGSEISNLQRERRGRYLT